MPVLAVLALAAAAPETERGPAFAPMRGIEWQLTRIGDAKPVTRRPITLTLSQDDRASGHSGCNTYTATFRMNAGKLSFPGPIAATQRACPDGMEAESAYLARLAKGGRARVELGKRLRIRTAGEPDLVFEPPAP